MSYSFSQASVVGAYFAAVSDRTLQKLYSFSSLRDGWEYGRGKAISSLAISAAHYVLNEFFEMGSENVEVFPRPNGGVLVSGYQGETSVDFYIYPDLTAEAVVEDVQSGDEIAAVNMTDFPLALTAIREGQWLEPSSSGLHIRYTTATRSAVSSQRRLKTLAMEPVYRQFARVA